MIPPAVLDVGCFYRENKAWETWNSQTNPNNLCFNEILSHEIHPGNHLGAIVFVYAYLIVVVNIAQMILCPTIMYHILVSPKNLGYGTYSRFDLFKFVCALLFCSLYWCCQGKVVISILFSLLSTLMLLYWLTGSSRRCHPELADIFPGHVQKGQYMFMFCISP